MVRRASFLAAVFLFAASATATAGAREHTSYGPLPYRTMNPLYLQFLQMRPERAVTLPAGTFFAQLILPYSNMFERAASAATGYDLDLDMEMFRPSFLLKYGAGKRWEVAGELSFASFHGGFLDSFVQGFHNAFGFPNGGRSTVPNGAFDYRLSRNGVDLVNTRQKDFRPADFTFDLKHLFLEESRLAPAVAGAFYLKIPLAGPSSGVSSGRPDFGVVANLEKNYKRLHGYLNAGVVVLGGHEDLSPLLNAVAFTWMTGLEITAVQRYLSVLVQLQGSTPLFSGAGFPELDSFPLELVIGFAGQAGPIFWQAAFGEDPNANGPSVDFTAFVTVGVRFGGVPAVTPGCCTGD